MADILISYASGDRTAGEALAEELRRRDIEVELTRETFAPEVIESCAHLVLLLSGRTADSERVMIEVAWALQAGKSVVAAVIEATSLVPFPFVTYSVAVDFTRDGAAALGRLLAALGIGVSAPIAGFELPPSKDEGESPLVLDEETVAALFFGAAELGEQEAEKAIFLYTALMRFAPEYGDAQLREFISAEIKRLEAVRLEHMKEAWRAALKRNQGELSDYILTDMKLIDADAPATQAVIAALWQAQLEALEKDFKTALTKQDWEQASQLIEIIGGRDKSHNALLRQQLDNARLEVLERAAEAAIKEQSWKLAEQIFGQIATLEGSSNKGMGQKLFEAQIRWGEHLSKAALAAGEWAVVETVIERLADLKTEDTVLKQESLGRLGGLLIEKEQWDLVERLAARLESVDNNRAQQIKTHILDARIRPFLQAGKEMLGSGQWEKAAEAARQVLALQPANIDAAGLLKRARDWMTSYTLYEQAANAVEAERFSAAFNLIQRIHKIIPNFGDPEGLLRGQPLTARTALFIGEVAQLEAHRLPITCLAFSPDGTMLLTGSAEETATLWELPGFEPKLGLKKHHEGVLAAAFSPDVAYIATLAHDGTLRVWSLTDEAQVFHEKGTFNRLTFSPDGQFLAAGDKDGQITFWATLDWSQKSKWFGCYSRINDLAFSLDGSQLAVGTQRGQVVVADVDRLARTSAPYGGSIRPGTASTPMQSVFFLQGGEQLLGVSGSPLATVYLWNRSGEPLGIPYPLREGISVVGISPDESLLVGAEEIGGMLRFWDRQSGSLLTNIARGGWGNKVVTFTPDDLYLVTGSRDGKVRFWGVSAEKEPAIYKGKRG